MDENIEDEIVFSVESERIYSWRFISFTGTTVVLHVYLLG